MRIALISLLMAASTSTGFANCIGDRALSPDEISRFKSDPSLYIAGKSDADVEAIAERLASTDGSTVDGFKRVLGVKSLPQQTAITVGLARAAQACSTSNPGQAREIQLVAVDLSPTLRTAFERTTGQRAVASIGAGAGSAGAAGGPTDLSDTTASNGGSSDPTEWSVDNGPTLFPFSGSPGASIDRTSSGGTTVNTSTTIVPNATNPAVVTSDNNPSPVPVGGSSGGGNTGQTPSGSSNGNDFTPAVPNGTNPTVVSPTSP